jgi:hypothetical protein
MDNVHSGSCAMSRRVLHVGMFLPKSACFFMGYTLVHDNIFAPRAWSILFV